MLISHHFYPDSNSLNTFIDPALTSVTYTQLDEVIDISAVYQGVYLGKVNIKNKSAFRLLPVYQWLDLHRRLRYFFEIKDQPVFGVIHCVGNGIGLVLAKAMRRQKIVRA